MKTSTRNETAKQRLEYLRGELRKEGISYCELAELQSLRKHIAPDDAELLEAAGVPETGSSPPVLKAKLISGWTDRDDDPALEVSEATLFIQAKGIHHEKLSTFVEAAPELLEALRHHNESPSEFPGFCSCPLEDGTRPNGEHSTKCQMARAAIARAASRRHTARINAQIERQIT